MYGKLSIRYLVPMLLAALIGCQQAEEVSPVTPDSPREPASLVLTSDFSALIASASRTNDADDNTIRHVSSIPTSRPRSRHTTIGMPKTALSTRLPARSIPR